MLLSNQKMVSIQVHSTICEWRLCSVSDMCANRAVFLEWEAAHCSYRHSTSATERPRQSSKYTSSLGYKYKTIEPHDSLQTVARL